MKSRLTFLNESDHSPSNCGDPLDIKTSSHGLGWDGIIVEKGWSPHFYPTQIVTPYFYFALAIDHELSWKVAMNEKFELLKTNPGDIWVNPPWTPFTHEINEPCFFIILAVVEERLISAYPGKLSMKDLQFLNNYNLQDLALKNYIELFYHEVEDEGANGRQYIENLLKLISVYFINNYSNHASSHETQKNSRVSKDQIKEIRNFINDNIGEPITIDDLAAELNMSKFYFLKEFKKAASVTPYQYLMDLRMEKAKELIADRNLSLMDLAINLGFSDQSHFSRVFKNYFGDAPGVYRKKILGENQ